MKRILVLIVATIFSLVCFLSCQSKKTESTETRNWLEGLSIPDQYREPLLDFEKLVTFRLSENFEEDYNNKKMIPLSNSLEIAFSETSGNWSNMLVEMTYGGRYLSKESYGYILQDINGDDFPELFWVRADHRILAIFTVFDEKLYLLDAFWPKHDCFVTDSLELCVVSTGGATNNDYEIKKLEEDSPKFVSLKAFGTDGSDETNSVIRYELTETGARVQITESRLEELLSQYPFYGTGSRWEKTQIIFLSP